MKAHASGGATPRRPSPDAGPPRPSIRPAPTTTSGSAAVGKPPSAVKKGFLDSGGGGVLYGEAGSREGGAVGRKGGGSSKMDLEFDRLVALADPEMGDGATGPGGKVSQTVSYKYSIYACKVVCSLLGTFRMRLRLGKRPRKFLNIIGTCFRFVGAFPFPVSIPAEACRRKTAAQRTP